MIVLVLVTSARTFLMKYLLDMDGQECEASKESLDRAQCSTQVLLDRLIATLGSARSCRYLNGLIRILRIEPDS